MPELYVRVVNGSFVGLITWNYPTSSPEVREPILSGDKEDLHPEDFPRILEPMHPCSSLDGPQQKLLDAWNMAVRAHLGEIPEETFAPPCLPYKEGWPEDPAPAPKPKSPPA